MPGPTVETAYGTLEGIEKRGVRSFRGIPYAAPPVGRLRFAPPETPAPWTGVREATTYGPAAAQNDSPLMSLLGDGDAAAEGGKTATSEADALTLNVFTPATDGAARPVLVWLHGGAYLIGMGSTPWYDGTNLARDRDVVVVTINYRLGSLGFLHLGGLGGEAFAGSANCGTLDQVAALRWVQDNIAAFGGDPGNVTVFGESAGGMSVGTLLGMPAARGLFHRAIPQSGACGHVHDAETAEAVAREMLDALDIPVERVAEIRDVPLDRLLRAQAAVAMRHFTLPGLSMPFQPAVDGVTLPEQPIAAIRAGAAADVPVLTGTTLQEMNLWLAFDPRVSELDQAGLHERIGRVLPEADAGDVEALYRKRLGDEASPGQVLVAIMTDAVFRVPAMRLLEAQAPHQADTYSYIFCYSTPVFGGVLGASHALELTFMFDNLDAPGAGLFVGEPDADMRALARAMGDAWCAFARSGVPAADGLPSWPRWDADRRATMRLAPGASEVIEDPFADERPLWDGYDGHVGIEA
ncbi:MAG TPA: carboxylesterase/lipase family protein [Acidimicrobiia bacterium]|nr:carboxylesterase/lipase family protein [Acidimicrobiia bacterium]